MKSFMDILLFSAVAVYFAAALLQFSGIAFKRGGLIKLAWFAGLVGFALHTGYLLCRGIAAGRLPLANQFEFAASLAWGIALLHIVLRVKLRQDWLSTVSMPAVFLVLSYAVLLPREIGELMPALKSAWFGLHIGSAVFAYASFALAGGIGIKYLLSYRRDPNDSRLELLDYVSYRIVAFGFMLLTVVILSGCVWAEQAWSSFWSWDPKETWALITWIIYSIYLHQRLRKGAHGRKMAVYTIIALLCVIFTFIGVNTLLSGLHSYA